MIGNKQALLIVGGVFLFWYIFVFAVALYARKENPEGFPKPRYDERQLADQMKGMKYGFYTLLVYLVLWMVLDFAGVVLWGSAFGAALGVMLGIGVFSVYCILSDALYQPGEKDRLLVPLLVNFCLFNIGIGVVGFTGEELFHNGMLTAKASPYLFLFYLIMFDAALLLRKAADKRK